MLLPATTRPLKRRRSPGGHGGSTGGGFFCTSPRTTAAAPRRRKSHLGRVGETEAATAAARRSPLPPPVTLPRHPAPDPAHPAHRMQAAWRADVLKNMCVLYQRSAALQQRELSSTCAHLAAEVSRVRGHLQKRDAEQRALLKRAATARRLSLARVALRHEGLAAGVVVGAAARREPSDSVGSVGSANSDTPSVPSSPNLRARAACLEQQLSLLEHRRRRAPTAPAQRPATFPHTHTPPATRTYDLYETF